MTSVDQSGLAAETSSSEAAIDVSSAKREPPRTDFLDLINKWAPETEEWRPLSREWSDRLAPATHGAWEYCSYCFQLSDADSVRLGDGKVIRPKIESWYDLQFENIVGTVQLTAMRADVPVSKPLWLEVLSAKAHGFGDRAGADFETALAAHVAFFDALIEDLANASEGEVLPTMLERLAERPFSPVAREPDIFFSYIVLRNFAGRIRQGVELVLADPHRKLVDVADHVTLHQVTHVDELVLLDALTSPERVRPAPGEEALARVFGGTLPRRWCQPIVVLTHDTPENRFILHVLGELQQLAARLTAEHWWSRMPEPARNQIGELADELRVAVRHPVMREVERMRTFPAASQILIRREGYRALRLIWELLHQALVPLKDDLNELIHLRRVDKLYEFWCMVSLSERIRRILPHEEFELRVEGGIRQPELVAKFGTRYQLRYQVRFEPDGNFASYSLPLIPDFVWFEDGKPRVVLDAKYRLAEGQFVPEQEATATDDSIYKMHTYRDALEGVRAALCLYPGSRDDLFEVRKGRSIRSETVLLDVLFGDWEGVGTLGMRPGLERSSG